MTGLVYPRSGFIGFDHIFDQLENIHKHAKDTYPPHNVVKDDELKYTIEMAVAGFKQEHIDIEIKDHVLTIKGERPSRRRHRGPRAGRTGCDGHASRELGPAARRPRGLGRVDPARQPGSGAPNRHLGAMGVSRHLHGHDRVR